MRTDHVISMMSISSEPLERTPRLAVLITPEAEGRPLLSSGLAAFATSDCAALLYNLYQRCIWLLWTPALRLTLFGRRFPVLGNIATMLLLLLDMIPGRSPSAQLRAYVYGSSLVSLHSRGGTQDSSPTPDSSGLGHHRK